VAGVIEDKHKKWPKIFFKVRHVFLKMGASPKKVFIVYAGLLMQRSFEVNAGYMPSALPNSPQKYSKIERLIMAISRSWFFHCAQLPGNFSADALVHSMYVLFI